MLQLTKQGLTSSFMDQDLGFIS